MSSYKKNNASISCRSNSAPTPYSPHSGVGCSRFAPVGNSVVSVDLEVLTELVAGQYRAQIYAGSEEFLAKVLCSRPADIRPSKTWLGVVNQGLLDASLTPPDLFLLLDILFVGSAPNRPVSSPQYDRIFRFPSCYLLVQCCCSCTVLMCSL